MSDANNVAIEFTHTVDDYDVHGRDFRHGCLILELMGWDKSRGGDVDFQIEIVNRGVAFWTDVRELYWTTDYPSNEIRDAYMPGRSYVLVGMVAGPVRINKRCVGCDTQMYARSRNHLKDYINQQCRDGGIRCDKCWEPWRDMQVAKRNAEWYARHPADKPLPSPDRGTSYQDYLQTDHWKERRTSALRRAGFTCQVCSAKGELHVHHRTYARRGHELDTDLIVLCADCHKIFHNNGKLADGGRAL